MSNIQIFASQQDKPHWLHRSIHYSYGLFSEKKEKHLKNRNKTKANKQKPKERRVHTNDFFSFLRHFQFFFFFLLYILSWVDSINRTLTSTCLKVFCKGSTAPLISRITDKHTSSPGYVAQMDKCWRYFSSFYLHCQLSPTDSLSLRESWVTENLQTSW